MVPVGRPGAAALCVASVALGDIHVPFASQTWHFATSTFHWRAWSPLVARGAAALCVAGVARMALGWIWWRALIARGAAALCVAGVALGDIHLRFAWHTTLPHTHTHNSSTFTYNFSSLIDPPPPPLSFLPSPSRFNFNFSLLEEVDLWGYRVL